LNEEQKENLKDVILECIIKRHNVDETLSYVKNKLGVDVMTHDHNRIRGELKRELGTNLKHLQRDKSAYPREFFKRIEEIRLIQKNLWRLIDENPDKPELQKDCLKELNQSTVTLGDLYKSIQELDQKEVFDQKEDELEEQISEQTMDESNVKSPRAEIQTSTHRIAKYTSDGKVVITQN
jgi:hypothetical protein